MRRWKMFHTRPLGSDFGLAFLDFNVYNQVKTWFTIHNSLIQLFKIQGNYSHIEDFSLNLEAFQAKQS